MSVSEISIFKCVGDFSELLYKCLRDLEQLQNSVEGLVETKTPQVSKIINTKAEELVAKYGDVSLVYAAKYIDNESVAGSSIENVRRICSPLNLKDGLLQTEDFRIWFIMPKGKPDNNLLGRLGNRKVIKRQASERIMFFNIKEACHSWEGLEISSLILILEKILGPTWTDEGVRKSCQGRLGYFNRRKSR